MLLETGDGLLDLLYMMFESSQGHEISFTKQKGRKQERREREQCHNSISLLRYARVIVPSFLHNFIPSSTRQVDQPDSGLRLLRGSFRGHHPLCIPLPLPH